MIDSESGMSLKGDVDITGDFKREGRIMRPVEWLAVLGVANPVENTTNETTLVYLTNSCGSLVVPDNLVYYYGQLDFEAYGFLAIVGGGSLEIKAKADSTVMGTTGAISPATSGRWRFRLITEYQGGSAYTVGEFLFGGVVYQFGAHPSVDLSQSHTWDLTATFSTASAVNTISLYGGRLTYSGLNG